MVVYRNSFGGVLDRISPIVSGSYQLRGFCVLVYLILIIRRDGSGRGLNERVNNQFSYRLTRTVMLYMLKTDTVTLLLINDYYVICAINCVN